MKPAPGHILCGTTHSSRHDGRAGAGAGVGMMKSRNRLHRCSGLPILALVAFWSDLTLFIPRLLGF